MKKFFLLLLPLLLLWGCTPKPSADIAATTLPVYDFTSALCQGTPLTVTRLVTEEVSCLHNYSLNVRQVQAAEAADVIVQSGAGLEEFLHDVLENKSVIDASEGIDLLCAEEDEDHHEHHAHEGHSHEEDPHIWLSPENAAVMAENICRGLCQHYPQYQGVFQSNLPGLLEQLASLQAYGEQELAGLSCREMIPFHDGFSYFARSFGLTIVEAVEEESGSEASAKELIHLIELVREHGLPAIFVEKNGSGSAASILSRETGAKVYTLDMAMSGSSYFDAMYHNIDTIKEALQ